MGNAFRHPRAVETQLERLEQQMDRMQNQMDRIEVLLIDRQQQRGLEDQPRPPDAVPAADDEARIEGLLFYTLHLEGLAQRKMLGLFLEAPEIGALVQSCRRLRGALRDVEMLPPDGDLRTTCWFDEGGTKTAWHMAQTVDPVIRTRTKLERPTVAQLVPYMTDPERDDLDPKKHAEELVKDRFPENASWESMWCLAPVGIQRDDQGALIVGLNLGQDELQMEGLNCGFWWDTAGRFRHAATYENTFEWFEGGWTGYRQENIYVTSNGRFTVTCSTHYPRTLTAEERKMKEHKDKRWFTIHVNHDRIHTSPPKSPRECISWVCACWSREEDRTLVVGIPGPPALLLIDTTSWTTLKTIPIPKERLMVGGGPLSNSEETSEDAWRKFHVLAVACRNAPDGSLAIVALVETDRRKSDNETLASLLLFRADGQLLAETTTDVRSFANIRGISVWKSLASNGYADTMKLLGDSIFLLQRDKKRKTIAEYILRFQPSPSLTHGRVFENDPMRGHARSPSWLFAIHNRLITVDQKNIVVFWDATSGQPRKTILLPMGTEHVIGSWLTPDGLVVLRSDGTGAEVLTIS